MLRVDINDKRFTVVENTHGVSGADTVFHYHVDGAVITGSYAGGRIRAGRLVGQATSPDTIDLLFQCVTTGGELMAGQSRGRVGQDSAGRATLEFEWSWLTGDRGGGTSRYLEMRGDADQSGRTVIVKRFDAPDEVRAMTKGRFEVVHLGGIAIGRATYEPGWRWSEHVGPAVGATRCSVEHVGLVLSGTATAAFADGRVVELEAGQLFYVPPEPHDSWVVGEDPYVSLHFLGAERYAR